MVAGHSMTRADCDEIAPETCSVLREPEARTFAELRAQAAGAGARPRTSSGPMATRYVA